jgi:hypothetical protein
MRGMSFCFLVGGVSRWGAGGLTKSEVLAYAYSFGWELWKSCPQKDLGFCQYKRGMPSPLLMEVLGHRTQWQTMAYLGT